jgi:hypothetical protein
MYCDPNSRPRKPSARLRWTLVRDTRVVEVDEPVNYRWADGRLQAVS